MCTNFASGEIYTPSELKSCKVHCVPDLRSRKHTVAELFNKVDAKKLKSRRHAMQGLFEQKHSVR